MRRPAATHRAVLRRYLSAQEEAGELLARWGSATIAWTFGSAEARRELARVEDEEEVGRAAP